MYPVQLVVCDDCDATRRPQALGKFEHQAIRGRTVESLGEDLRRQSFPDGRTNFRPHILMSHLAQRQRTIVTDKRRLHLLQRHACALTKVAACRRRSCRIGGQDTVVVEENAVNIHSHIVTTSTSDPQKKHPVPSIFQIHNADREAQAINRRFCTAAPAAPLPRLSSTALKTIWPVRSLHATARLMSLVPL